MNERTSRCVSPEDPSQRESVAAYALGALEPAEADLVALHLAACESCRVEYMDVLDMLPLLASVSEQEAVSGPVRPDPALLGNVIATSLQPGSEPYFPPAEPTAQSRRVAAHKPVRHARGSRGGGPALGPGGVAAETGPRTRRSRLVMATAAVFLAVIGSFVGVRLASSEGSGSAVSWTASAEAAPYNGVQITASLQVSQASWGSRLTLHMDHVPKGYQCSMLVVGTDGKQQSAGSWKAPTSGNFTIPGTVSLAPDQIASVRVRLPDGTTLLTFNHDTG